MQIPFSYYVGLRYTGAKRRSQLVSFLSAVSITGLAVGVALLIAVLSIMNGFDRELRERILGLVPQAAIYHRQGIHDWETLLKELEKDKDIVSAAPFVQLTGMLRYRNNTSPLMLYGIDPVAEQRVSIISEFVDKEILMRLNSSPASIILGKHIAEELEVNVGNKIMVLVANTNNAARAPKIAYLTVIDIFNSKTELDTSLALTSLVQAAELSPYASADQSQLSVSGIRLKLTDLFDAPNIVYRNLLALGQGYYGTNWTRTQGNLYHAIHMSKNLVGLLMSLIVAIAAFNVVSTLVMVVVDKQGDIAILRTLGASTRQIMGVFVVQGSVVGLIGTSLGIFFGCILALGAQSILNIVESLLGVQFLKSDVYPLTDLPSQILFADILRVASTALILSFLSTLYPAWKASRVEPAEALRYE